MSKKEERITCYVPSKKLSSKEAFIDLGFTFHVIPNCDLELATFPDGWKSVAADNYWLKLVDEKGCQRGIYRYGYSDLMTLITRFYVFDDDDVIDTVNGKSLYNGVNPEDFLNEHYPDWEDPTKYWELEEDAIKYI